MESTQNFTPKSTLEMKLFVRIVLVTVFLWHNLAQKDTQEVHVQYVKCNFSTEYFFLNYTCAAKSWNRSYSTLTIQVTPRKVLTWALVRFYAYFRKNVLVSPRQWFLKQAVFYFYFKSEFVYREVLHIKPFDWCQCMIQPTLNPSTKFILNLLNESAVGLAHACPYHDINITKAPIRTSSVGGIFPSGTYKIFFNLKNQNHVDIFSVMVVITNNSTNKDTFEWKKSYKSDGILKCFLFIFAGWSQWLKQIDV